MYVVEVSVEEFRVQETVHIVEENFTQKASDNEVDQHLHFRGKGLLDSKHGAKYEVSLHGMPTDQHAMVEQSETNTAPNHTRRRLFFGTLKLRSLRALRETQVEDLITERGEQESEKLDES